MFVADAKSRASGGSPSTSRSSLAATARPHKSVGIGSLSPATTAKPSGKALLPFCAA